MLDYSEKPANYFSNARKEIEPLITGRDLRVLEIGCGEGQTLQWLQVSGIAKETVGVELMPGPAKEARQRVTRVIETNIETAEFPSDLGAFDLVLCLDVLEHMVDPWKFVQRIQSLMLPDSSLIASVPNVRHIRVVAPLLLMGKWSYEDQGILDRTHLRFFTRSTAISMLSQGKLRPIRVLRNIGGLNSISGRLNFLTIGLWKDFFTTQFIINAKLSD